MVRLHSIQHIGMFKKAYWNIARSRFILFGVKRMIDYECISKKLCYGTSKTSHEQNRTFTLMPKDYPLLSLETATPVCSVALRLPDGSVLEERAEGKGVHSELTFVFIERLLKKAGTEAGQLGAVVISAGPGSYTGLRVASSAVKGLLFQTGIPLFACNTLGAFALGSRFIARKGPVPEGCDTVIDARRNHLYHQSWKFDERGLVPESEVVAMERQEVLGRWRSGRLLVGTGLERLLPDSEPDHHDAGDRRVKNDRREIDDAGDNGEGQDVDDHFENLPTLALSRVVNAANVLEFIWKTPDYQKKKIIKKVAPEHFEPYYYSGL